MGAIGERDEVINASQTFLRLSGDTYITLQNLEVVGNRLETREDVATGPIYFYSQHDNYMEGELLLTGPEVSTYMDLLDVTGGFLQSNNYDVVYSPRTGADRTIAVTALAPSVRYPKPALGATKVRIRFRILTELAGAVT